MISQLKTLLRVDCGSHVSAFQLNPTSGLLTLLRSDWLNYY